jgi:hypothetical protein
MIKKIKSTSLIRNQKSLIENSGVSLNQNQLNKLTLSNLLNKKKSIEKSKIFPRSFSFNQMNNINFNRKNTSRIKLSNFLSNSRNSNSIHKRLVDDQFKFVKTKNVQKIQSQANYAKYLMKVNMYIIKSFDEIISILLTILKNKKSKNKFKLFLKKFKNNLNLLNSPQRFKSQFSLKMTNKLIIQLLEKVLFSIKSAYKLLSPSETKILMILLKKERMYLYSKITQYILQKNLSKIVIPYLFLTCNMELKKITTNSKDTSTIPSHLLSASFYK